MCIRERWTVSVLTYDNEVIESEKDFDYTLNGLQTNTILADRKSTRLNSSHSAKSRMPSSA